MVYENIASIISQSIISSLNNIAVHTVLVFDMINTGTEL